MCRVFIVLLMDLLVYQLAEMGFLAHCPDNQLEKKQCLQICLESDQLQRMHPPRLLFAFMPPRLKEAVVPHTRLPTLLPDAIKPAQDISRVDRVQPMQRTSRLIILTPRLRIFQNLVRKLHSAPDLGGLSRVYADVERDFVRVPEDAKAFVGAAEVGIEVGIVGWIYGEGGVEVGKVDEG